MAEYDRIYREYTENIDYSPHRRFEMAALVKQLFNLTGKTCLDLACGEGVYARKLIELGARRVIGVDISSQMISVAKQKSTDQITYIVDDASAPKALGAFDVITAAYLLCYASTVQQLRKMIENIYRNLAPGGTFVALTDNPSVPIDEHYSTLRFGFAKHTRHSKLRDGCSLYWLWGSGQSKIWWYGRDTYEKLFKQVGFVDFKWFEIEYPNGEFTGIPPVVGIRAQKKTVSELKQEKVARFMLEATKNPFV